MSLPFLFGPRQVEYALKNMCVGEEDKDEDEEIFEDCSVVPDKIPSRLHVI